MAKDQVSFTVGLPGLPALLRDLNSFDKDVQDGVREAAGKVAADMVPQIIAAAAAEGPQAVLAARSVAVKRDRVPAIVAGGSKKLTTTTARQPRGKINPKTGKRGKPGKAKAHTVKAGDVFFGSEFGGGGRPTTHQFEPHRGTEGYWFFPTLRDNEDRMLDAYAAVLDEVLG